MVNYNVHEQFAIFQNPTPLTLTSCQLYENICTSTHIWHKGWTALSLDAFTTDRTLKTLIRDAIFLNHVLSFLFVFNTSRMISRIGTIGPQYTIFFTVRHVALVTASKSRNKPTKLMLQLIFLWKEIQTYYSTAEINMWVQLGQCNERKGM